MLILQIVQDTVVVKMSGSSSFQTVLITAIASIIAALIGALVTIRLKRKEFEMASAQLELQKQVLTQTIKNAENELKAELIRLKDLRKNTELNQVKHDFERLQELLNSLKDKESEKYKMACDLTKLIHKYYCEVPPYFEDYEDYVEVVTTFTYHNMEDMKLQFKELLKQYPVVFLAIHDEVNAITNEIENVIRNNYSSPAFYAHEDFDEDYIISKNKQKYLEIYERVQRLLEHLQSEYRELEDLKREFLKETVKKLSKKS